MNKLSEMAARLVPKEPKSPRIFVNKHDAEEASAALLEAEQLLRSALDDVVEGQHSGASDRREWWSGGTWLYPGSRVVYLSAEDVKRIRALIG